MNQKYVEILFERISGKERKAIIKTGLKMDIPRLKNIPGFRTPDAAPPNILKRWLKNEEKFWIFLLKEITVRYDCTISRYPNEELLPEMTIHNFWGIFAWNCFREDDSPESCSRLEQMLERYEILLQGEEASQQEKEVLPDSEMRQAFDDMPEKVSGNNQDDMPETGTGDMPETVPDSESERISEAEPGTVPETEPGSDHGVISEAEHESGPDGISEAVPDEASGNIPETLSEAMPEVRTEDSFKDEPEAILEAVPDDIAEMKSEITPQAVSQAAPNDLPEIASEAGPQATSETEPEDTPEIISGAALETAPETGADAIPKAADPSETAAAGRELQNQTDEEEPLDLMSGERQYIGYIQETNGYYNFWPACVMLDGMAKPLNADEMREAFPDLGNINLFSTPWDYIRKKCSNGEILVITLSPSDFMENRRQDGFFQRTNYKVDFYQLERQGRIRQLRDIHMYPVLHPVGMIDFAKKAVLVRENFVDTKDMCLIEEANVLYGPYRVSSDEDGRTQVNLTNRDVVDAYRAKSGEIEYAEINLDVPGYMRLSTGYVHLDDSFVREQQDKISDQDLFKLFQRSLAGRKNSEKFPIAPDQINQYTTSIFYGLPKEIAQSRITRIKSFFEEQFKQEEVHEEIAKFVADLFYKYGESGYFSNLLERILDNSELANKIQTFAIVKQRLSEMQQQYELVRQQCREEREKLDAETADREKQISQMAEKTSEEIQDLTAKRDELLAEVSAVQRQLNRLDYVINLDRERERLEAVNDNLRATECRLKEKGDEAVRILQDKLRQATANAVATAFDGKIADQVFQAAAKWNQAAQDTVYNEIAGQLTIPDKEEALRGDALREYLITSVRRYRPNYSKNEILNLFICVVQNFLTIFCGEPGSGKTSICNIIAHVLGTTQTAVGLGDAGSIEVSRYVPISVERGWTSKRDWIGYYNPLSQTFEKANRHLYDGLRLLHAEGERSQYPYIVLLDEASLSPMEYYWADFMNICDRDRCFGKITLGEDLQLQIPSTLRFTATINNDDTTEPLSPRLIDRAAVIALPDMSDRQTEEENQADSGLVKQVRWDALQEMFYVSSWEEMDAMPREIYEEIGKLFREDMRIGISSRTDRALRKYWAAAKELFESEDGKDATIIALDYAVAQKLLPRIKGSGDSYLKLLEKLEEICEKNNLVKCEKSLKDIIKRGKASMNYYQYF